ncbi:MAG: peptidoglycan bridge formation glycyltransferase FemA/FemB family protein [Chloroflexota bacterium]|nr:peptidoglycan bridge formation glycyltransferase FemA/FemB family protein [Chloroflexota bacterium]
MKQMNDAQSLTPDLQPGVWDSFVAAYPAGHILQTSPWGALKAEFGWIDERVGLGQGGELVTGAQVLYRRLPAGLGYLAYVPMGPLVDWTGDDNGNNENEKPLVALLATLDRAARSRKAIALMLEPALPDEAVHRERLRALGLRPSPFDSLQPRRTIVVDISPDEDTILAAMKSKTRYNVRLAGRKGVTVREATEADLPAFHALVAVTAARDRFGVHTPAYYEAAYRLFVPRDWARLLLAEVEGKPVAALMVFALPPRAWYFYGASGDAYRERMPTYLLQWEAMRWAKSMGCTTYDLWGVPDEDEATLEAEFTRRRDGLWGVYRFKRGFGGQLVRSVGAWDRVYTPARYRLYQWMLGARNWMLKVRK